MGKAGRGAPPHARSGRDSKVKNRRCPFPSESIGGDDFLQRFPSPRRRKMSRISQGSQCQNLHMVWNMEDQFHFLLLKRTYPAGSQALLPCLKDKVFQSYGHINRPGLHITSHPRVALVRKTAGNHHDSSLGYEELSG